MSCLKTCSPGCLSRQSQGKCQNCPHSIPCSNSRIMIILVSEVSFQQFRTSTYLAFSSIVEICLGFTEILAVVRLGSSNAVIQALATWAVTIILGASTRIGLPIAILISRIVTFSCPQVSSLSTSGGALAPRVPRAPLSATAFFAVTGF